MRWIISCKDEKLYPEINLTCLNWISPLKTIRSNPDKVPLTRLENPSINRNYSPGPWTLQTGRKNFTLAFR